MKKRLLGPRRAGALAAVLTLVAAVHLGVDAEDQQVVWTNLVNVSIDSTGTILQKTAGCAGCSDAGATATQRLTAGEGDGEGTGGDASASGRAAPRHGTGLTGYAGR